MEMRTWREVWLRWRERLLYLVFGGLTTLLDFAISFCLYRLWGVEAEGAAWLLHVADVLAWTAAVLFAFVTNRRFVFQSQRKGFLPIMGELFAFAGGRVFTFLLQEGIMAVFVTWLGLNAYLFRILAAVLVVILNYIISKLLVFRKKKTRETEASSEKE